MDNLNAYAYTQQFHLLDLKQSLREADAARTELSARTEDHETKTGPA